MKSHSLAMLRLILPALIPVLTLQACPPGYTYNEQYLKCYKVYEQAQTYFAAAHTCTLDGAQLASVHSSTENAYVLSKLRTHSDMLLFSDLITVQFGFNHWLGLTTLVNGFEYEWIDGTTVDYSSWGAGQPTSLYQCTSLDIDSSHWWTQDCDAKLPFVCNSRNCTS